MRQFTVIKLTEEISEISQVSYRKSDVETKLLSIVCPLA